MELSKETKTKMQIARTTATGPADLAMSYQEIQIELLDELVQLIRGTGKN